MAVYGVTDAFDDQLEPISIDKQTTGDYVNGEWVETRDTVSAKAVIHPMDYSEIIENDPTAPRDIQAIEFWTETKVRTVDTVDEYAGDVIIWNNKRWRVVEIEDWNRIGGYYSGIAYLDKEH